jgi:hypothetical protein
VGFVEGRTECEYRDRYDCRNVQQRDRVHADAMREAPGERRDKRRCDREHDCHDRRDDMLSLCVCTDTPSLKIMGIKRRSSEIKMRTHEGNKYVENDAGHLETRQERNTQAKRIRPEADNVARTQ